MKSIYYTLLCYILGAKGKAGAKRRKMMTITMVMTQRRKSVYSVHQRSPKVCV